MSNLKRFNYYGPEWQLIRAFGILRMPQHPKERLARERDKGQCRLSYYPISGSCSDGSATLHVHHDKGRRSLVKRAYKIAASRDEERLMAFLQEHQDLFPTLCGRHHYMARKEGREWLEEQLAYVRWRRESENGCCLTSQSRHRRTTTKTRIRLGR